MYVTLEPCCHHGLTPPCTNIIIKSKISEVIYSVADIDKRVRNKSLKILKSNNIKVKKVFLKIKLITFIQLIFLIEKINYLMLLEKLLFQKIILFTVN